MAGPLWLESDEAGGDRELVAKSLHQPAPSLADGRRGPGSGRASEAVPVACVPERRPLGGLRRCRAHGWLRAVGRHRGAVHSDAEVGQRRRRGGRINGEAAMDGPPDGSELLTGDGIGPHVEGRAAVERPVPPCGVEVDDLLPVDRL
jgi:hypothetical protein